MVKHPGKCSGEGCRLCNIAINQPDFASALWGGKWAVYQDVAVPDGENTIRVVVTANGLGDHVLGLCVLPELVKAHPDKRIVYHCKFDRMLPWMNLFETGAEYAFGPGPGFTLKPHDTYSKQLAETTIKGRWTYYAEACGVEAALPTVRPISRAAIDYAKQYAGRVLLAPWSCYKDRQWSLAHWLELEKLLTEAGYPCLVLDDNGPRNNPFKSPKMIGETAERVAAVMMVSPCLVSIDSGLAHVAGALHRPAIVIAGQIQPDRVFGIYPTVRGLRGGFACDGCHWRGEARRINQCQSFCFSMAAVTPAKVLETLQELTAFPRDRLAALWTQQDETNPHEDKNEWLARYQVLYNVVRHLQPKTIVEIGVRAGYSSWTMLEAAPEARLVGIDFDGDSKETNTHGGYKGAYRHAERINNGKDFTFILADSHKLDALPILEADLAYIDGDHTEAGCYADLVLAEKSNAKIILCDDYTTPEGPDFGVKTAIDRFCKERRLDGRLFPNGSTGLYMIDRQRKSEAPVQIQEIKKPEIRNRARPCGRCGARKKLLPGR